MTQSREYALKRLDLWYVGKFIENYSDELAVEVVEQIGLSLLESKLGQELIKDGTLRAISRKFFPVAQIIGAASFFTDAYATMEGIVEESQSEENSLDPIEKGFVAEYAGPMLEQHERLQQFVSRVRYVSGNDLGREVTNVDIDQAFLNTFGGHGGFTEFCKGYANAMPFALEMEVRVGEVSREKIDKALVVIEATKGIYSNLNEKLFGDLQIRE